jgi:hypothetical protein
MTGCEVFQGRLVLVMMEVSETERVLDPGRVVMTAGQLADARLALRKPEAAAVAVRVADESEQTGEGQRLLLGIFLGYSKRWLAKRRL